MSANKADVSSTQAIADFRSALLVYSSKLRPVLDDATDYVNRIRESLKGERRMYWENQLKHNTLRLKEAQQAVFSAELSKLRAPSAAELAAVQRFKRDLGIAEEKLRMLKKVLLNYDKETQPRLKPVEHLRGYVAVEIPKAAQHLDRLLEILDSYAQGSPPVAPVAPPVEPAKEEPS